ncbi:phosphoenolpyruvate--protein phosphotransferase [Siculibacillus lacustris]|uniref:Phosphoenolpyruvate-protein phosphotransferase n=1 Tax=Siculibacillus lacustris TaxID=1549641 RepID=A0A4Q9VER3_9HYPH|nr:phosphoenolpyruvate--protein phosphotransferase [Siculibacillus lacustris]TBW33298.1 phosphoenolpyruvate--protein phosphotransferase [Siculibacillus lacustris]
MERATIVRVREGLHARPATCFVKLAKSFQSDVEIVKGANRVNAKSSVKLMLASVLEADPVVVRTSGADEAEALEALVRFLEDPESGIEAGGAATPAAPAATRTDASADKDDGRTEDGGLRGIAASEGKVVGPVFGYFPPSIDSAERMLAEGEIDDEIALLSRSVAVIRRRMVDSLSAPELSPVHRGIIAALAEIVADDAVIEEMATEVRKGRDAVTAVREVIGKTAAAFAAVDDPYIAARADDVTAVGRQLCLELLGRKDIVLEDIPAGSILVAEDIGAFDLARAPLDRIGGIACAQGGATSHIAIIGRSHGIPTVLGLRGGIEALRGATEIALDGTHGVAYDVLDDDLRARFAAAVAKAAAEKKALAVYRSIVPKRADGTVIEVAANIGSLEEIDAARAAGAMGVGLFRSELLFMLQTGLPSEEMQYQTYVTLARAFAPHPVIVRTLDVGGDKPLAGIQFPEEANPFLGWRGIRMCLDRPDIFKPQLRALLRAAVGGNIEVMLPMVSDLGEVRRTRALIEDCAAELTAEGVPFERFAVGVMIETPAAVMIARELAKEVSFFSIGTNDLTQYIMAADRLNSSVAGLNDVTNIAVMNAIEMTARAGVEAGIMVGMCGEAAGRVDLIPRFIAMGLTELSMSPASIPRAKKCIVDLTTAT